MKPSTRQPLAWRQKPLNRREAWACLGINLGVCPGLGSVIGGRLTGFIQVLLAVAGVALFLVGGIELLAAWYLTLRLPEDPRAIWKVAAGLGLFAAGWVWSLVTSLQLLRETRGLKKG